MVDAFRDCAKRTQLLIQTPFTEGRKLWGKGMESGEEEPEEERRGEGTLGPDGSFPSPLLLGCQRIRIEAPDCIRISSQRQSRGVVSVRRACGPSQHGLSRRADF